MHEGRAAASPAYGRRALTTWAHRLAERWGARADGYVYFNNDAQGCAVRDARTFTRLAARAGLVPMVEADADHTRHTARPPRDA
jgi:uncharacterized protein YecE (DUF72 family)